RRAHRLQDEGLVGPGSKPGRSGITVDRPRAPRRSRVNGEVADVVHLLLVFENESFSPCQAQSASLMQQRIARYELQNFVVMFLADFSQATIAGKHLTAA